MINIGGAKTSEDTTVPLGFGPSLDDYWFACELAGSTAPKFLLQFPFLKSDSDEL